MKVIHKYVLDRDIIQLPAGAQILSIGVQRDLLCAWALVDPERTFVNSIRVVGTGTPIHDEHRLGKFRGTYQIHEGSLVFHVFDIN